MRKTNWDIHLKYLYGDRSTSVWAEQKTYIPKLKTEGDMIRLLGLTIVKVCLILLVSWKAQKKHG